MMINNVVCATSKGSDQPQNLSLKGGCTGSSESTLVKMPQYVAAYLLIQYFETNFP